MQLRGHCQCCGREQAVPNGRMAHHGYTVDYGFFNGTCAGHDFQPIEKERFAADRIVSQLRDEANADCIRACQLEAGSIDPEYVTVDRQEKVRSRSGFMHWGTAHYAVPFCYGDKFEQQDARRRERMALEFGAKQKRAFADMLERVADEYHGKPLVEYVKPAKAAAIEKGDKRVTHNGLTLTALGVEKARVYWETMIDGKRRTGWTGTRAWRALPAGAAQ